MKTKEELEQLKKRHQEMVAKLEELSEDELKEVVGGDNGKKTKWIDNFIFKGYVGKYDAKVGEWYYITDDCDYKTFYYGQLLKTYEKDNWLIGTTRTHQFHITMENCEKKDYIEEFSGDDYTLYTIAY